MQKEYIFQLTIVIIDKRKFCYCFCYVKRIIPLSAVFRWALPHMTTGPTCGLDDWFLSSPACIGILILTAIASLMLAIIYKASRKFRRCLEMVRLIKTEFLKYKRYNILWLGIVSVTFFNYFSGVSISWNQQQRC